MEKKILLDENEVNIKIEKEIVIYCFVLFM